MRVVLDTNIWLDLFVFDDPRVRALGTLVSTGRLQPLASQPMLDELRAVLAYAHLEARCADAPGLLARVGALCQVLPTPDDAGLPRCKDPHDQKFLDASLVGAAAVLVTKDRALLKLARRIRSFAIIAPGRPLDDWIAMHCPAA